MKQFHSKRIWIKWRVIKKIHIRIYEQFECPKDDEFIELLKTEKPEILVITEDWCGDAMMNNAILRKIAEAADLDVRVQSIETRIHR